MNNWLKVNDVSKALNISNSFIRKTICKEEFKDLIALEKPVLINYNEEFINKIQKYITKYCIKRNSRKERSRSILFDLPKNIIINPDILRGWTQSSIDCYLIGCNCSICKLKKIMSARCQMKQVVIELVRKFGAPNVERDDIL